MKSFRVNKMRLLLLLFVSGFRCLHGQVDLTPEFRTKEDDGILQKFIEFSDGGVPITLHPGTEWRVWTGSKSRVMMQKEGETDVSFFIESSGTRFPTTADGLIATAVALLPEGRSPEGVIADPVPGLKIAGTETWMIQIPYKFLGADRELRVFFLTFEHAQFRFVATGLETAVGEQWPAYESLLRSFQWSDESHLRKVVISMEKPGTTP